MANQELPDLVDQTVPAVVQIITSSGQGTGFVISDKGLVVTNKHVVGYNTFVKIITSEKKEYYGQVVASDPHIDCSILYVDAPFSGMLSLGDAPQARLGDSVVAIGHPYGYDYTISQGIISSKGRKNVNPTFKDVEFLQLDMGINPGNSGGPVIRRDNGKVVGMVTLGLQQGDNIGFAVPSNYVVEFVDKVSKITKEDALKSSYCTVCGSMNKEDSAYCIKCGSKINKTSLEEFKKTMPKTEQEREKEATAVEGKIKCPACGTNNEKDSRYCIKCGTTLK